MLRRLLCLYSTHDFCTTGLTNRAHAPEECRWDSASAQEKAKAREGLDASRPSSDERMIRVRTEDSRLRPSGPTSTAHAPEGPAQSILCPWGPRTAGPRLIACRKASICEAKFTARRAQLLPSVDLFRLAAGQIRLCPCVVWPTVPATWSAWSWRHPRRPLAGSFCCLRFDQRVFHAVDSCQRPSTRVHLRCSGRTLAAPSSVACWYYSDQQKRRSLSLGEVGRCLSVLSSVARLVPRPRTQARSDGV